MGVEADWRRGCAAGKGLGAQGVSHLDISGEVGPGPSCFPECDCDTIPVPRCHLVWRPCPSPFSLVCLPLLPSVSIPSRGGPGSSV